MKKTAILAEKVTQLWLAIVQHLARWPQIFFISVIYMYQEMFVQNLRKIYLIFLPRPRYLNSVRKSSGNIFEGWWLFSYVFTYCWLLSWRTMLKLTPGTILAVTRWKTSKTALKTDLQRWTNFQLAFLQLCTWDSPQKMQWVFCAVFWCTGVPGLFACLILNRNDQRSNR